MSGLKKYWKQFCSLIPVAALVFLDQTILPVALPSIRLEMQATETSLQWCVNAYILMIAILVMVCGKISDRFGHKKILMLGVFIFVGASIFCSLSQTTWMLISSRVLQGIGGALMFPSQTSMIALIFPPEKRGKAIGMIVSIGSLFLVLGPLVGGYLISVASWRWIFWINLPIGLFGLWMIYKYLPSSENHSGKIDLPGFAFFAIGVGALTLVFMEVANWGWTSPSIIVLLLIALIGITLLLYRETKAKHPFLDLALFKHPIFAIANVNITTIQFFLMIGVFRTIYFQDILKYTPLETGYLMFFSSIPLLFMAPIGGYLSDRFTPRLPIACGYVLLIFSSFMFAYFDEPSLPILIIALLTFGMGIPMIFTPSISSAISSAPKSKVGAAAGTISTLRMTGGTMGLALIHFFQTYFYDYFLSTEKEREAEVTSFSIVHIILAFLLILSFAFTFVYYNLKSGHHLPKGPAEGWD